MVVGNGPCIIVFDVNVKQNFMVEKWFSWT